MLEYAGGKWNPEVFIKSHDSSKTLLTFESAWAPMNPLLKRLHILTGWTIHNHFGQLDIASEFEGDFYAEAGQCREELRAIEGE